MKLESELPAPVISQPYFFETQGLISAGVSRMATNIKHKITNRVLQVPARENREPGANPGRTRHCDGEPLPGHSGNGGRGSRR